MLVGDGAFQMTGMELATAVRYKLNPIVIVMNNRGYGTERQMQDGPYNDLWPVRYHRLPEVLGAGRGFVIETERDLNAALAEAERHTESFCLLEVRLDPADRSPRCNGSPNVWRKGFNSVFRRQPAAGRTGTDLPLAGLLSFAYNHAHVCHGNTNGRASHAEF